ncbi:hypothetical protein ACFLQ1_01490, partial [Candidatus Auribacterota bacterium]
MMTEQKKPNLFKTEEKERKKFKFFFLKKVLILIALFLFIVLFPVNRTISGVAQVIPEKCSYIDSFQSGIITKVYFKDGES